MTHVVKPERHYMLVWKAYDKHATGPHGEWLFLSICHLEPE